MQQRVINEWLTTHRINERVSHALNLAAAAGTDPIPFLAEHFTQQSENNGKIEKVSASEILDLNGEPTIEVEVHCSWNGSTQVFGRSDVAKASAVAATESEPLDLFDGVENRFEGKGMTTAANKVGTVLAPVLIDLDARNQEDCDTAIKDLDESPHRAQIGGNTAMATSTAICVAGGAIARQPLYKHITSLFAQMRRTEPSMKFFVPSPSLLVMQFGKNQVDPKNPSQSISPIKLNEISIIAKRDVPVRAAINTLSTVYSSLERVLRKKFENLTVSADGAFLPPAASIAEAIGFLREACGGAGSGVELGVDVFVTIDVGAEHGYTAETRMYKNLLEAGEMSSDLIPEYYEKLVLANPFIVAIEDAAANKDYETWRKVTQRLEGKTVIVGDELYSSNKDLVRSGMEEDWAKGLTMKPNQAGTISDCLDIAKIYCAKMNAANTNNSNNNNVVNNARLVMARRSRDASNPFIADLAVATGAWILKLGGLKNSTDVLKLNRLMKIDDELREKDLVELWIPPPDPEQLAAEEAARAASAKKGAKRK